METTILSIVNSIRALLPKGASLSLSVHDTYCSIILHNAEEYCLSQGATVGLWYALEGDDARPQRNYEWTHNGVLFCGVESGGVTVEEALAENAAMVADKAA